MERRATISLRQFGRLLALAVALLAGAPQAARAAFAVGQTFSGLPAGYRGETGENWQGAAYKVDYYGASTALHLATLGTRTIGGETYLCVGWRDGKGDIPASGTKSYLDVTVARASSLTWVYRKAHGAAFGVSPLEQTLWGWGEGYMGQVGDGSVDQVFEPVQTDGTSATHDWVSVDAGGEGTVGVRADGTLWLWGRNEWSGQSSCADGVTCDNVPTQVGTDNDWVAAAVGGQLSVVAVKKDGTLWGWGDNFYGQLGLGLPPYYFAPVPSPTRVGIDADWAAVSAGGGFTLALKRDGSLWTWGTQIASGGGWPPPVWTSPVRVGSDNDWATVSAHANHVLALKKDGTLWAWGDNGRGQLGDGTFDARAEPAEVMPGTTWKAVATGMSEGSSAAVRSDGTLWTWGTGDDLGRPVLCDTCGTVPGQVGADTGWLEVSAGGYYREGAYMLGLKADGRLFSWGGQNWDGQLGLGAGVDAAPEPTQVGTGNDWLAAVAAERHVVALRSPARVRYELSPHMGPRLRVEGTTVTSSARATPFGGSGVTLGSWTGGTGDVPASGSAASVTFSPTQDSSLTWVYSGQPLDLTVDVDPAGLAPPVVDGIRAASGFYPALGAQRVDGSPALSAPAEVVLPGTTDRWACTGWTGTGVTPASGSGSTVAGATFGPTATIRWQYQLAKNLPTLTAGLSGATWPEADLKAAQPGDVVGTWKAGQPIDGSHNGLPFDENSSVLLSAAFGFTRPDGVYKCTGITVNTPGYTMPLTKNVNGDRTEFVISLRQSVSVTVNYSKTTEVELGSPILQPVGSTAAAWTAVTWKDHVLAFEPGHPADQKTDAFFWDDVRKTLYAVRPIRYFEVDWRSLGTGTPYQAVWGTPGQTGLIAGVPAELQPEGSPYRFEAVHVSESYDYGTWVLQNGRFVPPQKGRSLLRFSDTRDSNRPVFLTVEAVAFARPDAADACTIGTPVTETTHDDPEGRNGYVHQEKGLYDGVLAEADRGDAAYARDTRTGPIVAVNTDDPADPTDDLLVVWYQRGLSGVAGRIGWPVLVKHYDCRWPADPRTIVVAEGSGSGPLLDAQAAGKVYDQPDPTKPGYNPNEEHALLLGGRLYAIRDDLNTYHDGSAWVGPLRAAQARTSEPYVLLKYRDLATAQWAYDVYRVRATDADHDFTFGASVGALIAPPTPLDLLPLSTSSSVASGAPFEHTDGKKGHWAKAQGAIVMDWWYPLQAGFYYPPAANKTTGQAVPFLGYAEQAPGANGSAARPVTYAAVWPADAPTLPVGETLTTAKYGLPEISGMAAVRAISGGNLAQVIAPFTPRSVSLDKLATGMVTESQGGKAYFPALPYSLRSRVSYDPTAKKLAFQGVSIDSGIGEPLVLPNILSDAEKTKIRGLSTAAAWTKAVDDLYALAQSPLTAASPEAAPPFALTAGAAAGEGYVTLVENDTTPPTAAPIQLHVLRVGGGPYRGEIKVAKSDNPFDERLALRHSGDFGGRPQNVYFKWYYKPDVNGVPPRLPGGDPADEGWIPFDAGGWGKSEITIEGAGKLTLSDNWFTARYYYGGAYKDTGLVEAGDKGSVKTSGTPSETTAPDARYWSAWAGAPGGQTAQLAEGWIKRVVGELNPLDARVKDFRNNATNTNVSMVSQLGERYEGDIALNGSPENLNNLGLIEAYQTILDRGKSLSIDAAQPADYGPANVALLNAATRLSGFYTLLGNEAYADAQDPTIGYDSRSVGADFRNGAMGYAASSLFAFRNQVDSLLEEELALLRGRDDALSTTRGRPVYNRLIWNFTNAEGEVAYVQAYNVSDRDVSGVIDEKDAKIMYPQGHGDAWGHYLTALSTSYLLLRHPSYTWEPRIESVLVGGSPVPVDYLDERKFAQTAAAKARTGAEIVNLTYRRSYSADPEGQWQGYKDADPERAWGVDDWARRAGQGAYFDWVTASAMLPSEDPNPGHAGIQKIDRSTVTELREIPSQYRAVQQQLDAADAGLNPLGLAKGVVPFDLDPTFREVGSGVQGEYHFSQIYGRAVTALQNAANAFDFANRYTLMLRGNEDDLTDFRRSIFEQERDYTNRLIELFGYPYAGDIGPGQTYPAGYDGPDLFHFMYVNAHTFAGDTAGLAEPLKTYNATFADAARFIATDGRGGLGGSGGLTTSNTDLTVAYPTAPDGTWLFPASADWGQRRAPGEIQRALSDLISAQAAYKQGLKDLDGILVQIRTAQEVLTDRFNISQAKINLIDEVNGHIIAQQAVATELGLVKDGLSLAGDITVALTESIVGLLEQNVYSGTSGLGPHLVKDVTKEGGAIARLVVAIIDAVCKGGALVVQGFQDNLNFSAEVLGLHRDRMVEVDDARFEVKQMAKELGTRHFEAESKVIELFGLAQALEQAAGAYRSALAEGERLLDERETFRRYTAGDVQDARYQDLSFRTFRSDAVQKYRATFDLAARYTYLAAAAYDYETNLLGTDTPSGRHFLGDIVKRRSPGEIADGVPVAGDSGLSDPLARLGQNFAVYQSQLGLNNPQQEENRFSLRSELLRLQTDAAWRSELQGALVPDLRSYPPFVRYCRPFAPASAGPQPGLVIPFSTEITYGRNFFGWPLGPGESSLDPSSFTTKIGGVGVSLAGYESAELSNTPRAYLVPVGADVQRAPTDTDFVTRQWHVVDQKLPVPFPLSEAEFDNPGLIPINDLLGEEFGGIRQFSSFRVHYDGGDAFNASDLVMDSRLVGRSAWNTQWLLIIPGASLLDDPDVGLQRFIDNVTDIRLVLQTYAYSGN